MGGDALVTAAIVAQTVADVSSLAALTTATIAGHTEVAIAIAAAETSRVTYDISGGVAAGIQIAAHLVQMIRNYNDGVAAISNRDAAIDKQIDFMQQLQDLKTVQDLPMLLRKRDVLADLIIPSISFCNSDFGLYLYSSNDGLAVDGKSQQLSQRSLSIPGGWLLHEGMLKGMKSVGYTQNIDKNSDKRRVEMLRKSKSRLVRSAQATLKSEYSANDILTKYGQNATIHGGLADLYMQGFNSAGAALGVALGRLSNRGTGDGSGNGSG